VSVLDSLADRAQAASQRLAGQSGLKGKLADELADDAVFLRKLKPRLIAMRAKGRAPTSLEPEASAATEPSAPQRASSGPNPFVVAGIALVAGIAVAKLIDWRGHAHPRR
jgi:hypothetical protein